MDNTQAALELAPLAMIVHPDTRVHGGQTVATWLSARINIFIANVETTANVDGVTFRVQGRASAPASHWVDIVPIITSTAASAGAFAIGASEPEAETAIAVGTDPTGDIDYGSEVYLRDTNGASPTTSTADLAGAEANGEFFPVEDRTTGPDVVTIASGLAAAKDSSDEVYPDAEVFAFDIPNLGGFNQLRVIVEHRGATGSNIHYRVFGEAVTDVN